MLIKPAQATDDPATVAPVDIVLFAVKLWDTEKAGAQIKPIVSKDTRVITLQNGVDSVERLSPILGADSRRRRHGRDRDRHQGARRHHATPASSRKFAAAASTASRTTSSPLSSPRRKPPASTSHNRKRCSATVWEKFVFLVGISGAHRD